jgi:glutamate-1-semialdehyde 2,1-aminomutase
MKTLINEKGIPHQFNRFGSMLSLHFTEEKVTDFASACHADNELFKSYFHGMLERGVYLPPSAFESYFLNDALTAEDIAFTLEAFQDWLKTI